MAKKEAKTANDATASAATKAVCEEAAPARQARRHDKYSVDAKLGNLGLGMSFGSGDVMGRHLRITKLPLTMAQYKSIYGSGGALLAVGHQLVAFNDEDIPINLTNREKLNMIKFKMDKAREPGESNEVRLTFLPYGPSEDVAKQNGKVEDGRDAVGYMLSNPAQKPATPTNRRKRSNKDESISVIDKSPKRIPGPPIPSKNLLHALPMHQVMMLQSIFAFRPITLLVPRALPLPIRLLPTEMPLPPRAIFSLRGRAISTKPTNLSSFLILKMT